jgi:hypothetical protein
MVATLNFRSDEMNLAKRTLCSVASLLAATLFQGKKYKTAISITAVVRV